MGSTVGSGATRVGVMGLPCRRAKRDSQPRRPYYPHPRLDPIRSLATLSLAIGMATLHSCTLTSTAAWPTPVRRHIESELNSPRPLLKFPAARANTHQPFPLDPSLSRQQHGVRAGHFLKRVKGCRHGIVTSIAVKEHTPSRGHFFLLAMLLARQ